MRKPLAVIVVLFGLTLGYFGIKVLRRLTLSDDATDISATTSSSLQLSDGLCERGGVNIKWGSISKKTFDERLVHLDLKGAPPKMQYLMQLLPLFKTMGATGLLVEYEDMYPYVGNLEVLHSENAYTEEEIVAFIKQAHDNGLYVVPLVQTFGHLEFVLKHDKFKNLRATPDNPMSLCVMNKGSLSLVKDMIRDMMRLHPNSKFVHLGGDEVYNLGECELDKNLRWTKDALYIHHMKPALQFVRNEFSNVRPIIWHDMLSRWSDNEMRELVGLVEPMVWEYRPSVETFVSADILKRFSSVFPRIWAASAFKGASGHVADYVPIAERIQNHASWSRILQSFPGPGKLVGIALTGWSRYDHYAAYCELLPAGIPSLGLCLATLKSGYLTDSSHKQISKELGISYPIPLDKTDAVTFFSNKIHESVWGFDIYSLSLKLVQAQCQLEAGVEVDRCWSSLWHVEHKFVNYHKLIPAKEILTNALKLYENIEREAGVVLPKFYSAATTTEFQKSKVYAICLHIKELLSHVETKINKFAEKTI